MTLSLATTLRKWKCFAYTAFLCWKPRCHPTWIDFLNNDCTQNRFFQ